MGNLVSRATLLFQATRRLKDSYDILVKRIAVSPGLPVPNPTLPFWTVPAVIIPASDTAPLPEYADIVIIGSGITGASFAHNALSRHGSLNVIMLEARDVCSGATGRYGQCSSGLPIVHSSHHGTHRNGGHINAPLYHDYSQLKEKYGDVTAKKMIRFRLAHLREMRHVADTEDTLKVSQCRGTEHIDVFTCPDSFAEAKEQLLKWQEDMPEESEGSGFLDRNDAIKEFRLSEATVGCIYDMGGAIHPYRFVTSLLAKLSDRYSGNFSIATHTPCTAIVAPSPSSPRYKVITPRGTISTSHVVHATNGWCSHLLEPMRGKIIPSRGTMSAQRPGTLLRDSTADGSRSWVFYRGAGAGYDYLTQLPTGEHELMFGGGWAQRCEDGLPELGLMDDSQYNLDAAGHLAGALPLYFGAENWGGEAMPGAEGDVRWGAGRTKAQWSGVLGISVDGLPWVGRLPGKVSGRAEPPRRAALDMKDESAVLAAPGEWISAGYSGEGMPHAWMSGKALSCMVLDREDELESWFPDVLRVTETRWKEADLDALLERFI
ncbi:FAD dependent oxidoreductase [Amylocystis lapponica]|nr:FAD dependent oxidoreductase [Amylocystis lapponica]